MSMIFHGYSLDNYGEILPSNFIKSVRDSIGKAEERLKSISEAHQSEKKDLVALHARLSSLVDQGEKTRLLKSQLISLSARQKHLLQCFVKQKEISNKFVRLMDRETKAKRTGWLRMMTS